MARDENAVLAVRICGLAFAALGLCLLVREADISRVIIVALLRGAPGSIGSLPLAAVGALVLGVVVGLAVMLMAPRLSRLAAPAAPEGAPAVREPVRLAALVIGLVLAMSLVEGIPRLPQLLAAGSHAIWNPWLPLVAAVVLLFIPGPIVDLVQRRADAGPTGLVLGAGLAIMGLWMLIRHLTSLAFSVESLLTGWGSAPPGLHLRSAILSGARAVVAAAMLWWSGRIARRLAPAERGPEAPGPMPGPEVYLSLAVFLIGWQAVVLPLARGAVWSVPSDLLRIPPAATEAIVLGVKAVLVVAAAWAIRALGPWLGGLLQPADAERKGGEATALGMLQIGLILAALLCAAGRGSPVLRAPLPGPLGGVVVGLALLAFWAEIARWLLRRRRTSDDALRAWRVAVLRPYLVLLGIWIGLPSLVGLLGWALDKVPGLLPPVAWAPGQIHVTLRPEGLPLLWIAGLALVLAAGPLSRWLGHESLFGRWWKLGWGKGPEARGNRGQGEHE